jgi:hypothetical protein
LRVDDHGRTQFTLVQAARLIGADQRPEIAFFEFRLEAIAQNFRAVGIAAATAVARLAAIAADKNVAGELGHRVAQ